MNHSIATRVLVVGGGPGGLVLAMCLARHGVDVLVAETRQRGEAHGVKCNHVSARSMELFRQLGIASAVRNCGLPADFSNDVAFRTTTTGAELARIAIPSREHRYTDTSEMIESSSARMRELIMGFRATQLVHVAARLKLADHLSNGARSSRQLADLVGADEHALHRTLRALASLGLLVQRGDEFALTALGDWLRSERDGSLRELAVLYGEPWLWQAYGALLHSVRSGDAAFPHVHGKRFFDFLAERPSESATFDDAMSGYSASEAAAIIEAYDDFHAMHHVVDVGGGRGVLLGAVLRRHEHLDGTLFDREPEVAAAQPAIAEAGRAAMTEERSRLLLIERLIPDDDTPSEAKLFDINMLVTLGGQERSAHEYEALLRAVRLRITRIVPTACALSVIEAVPVLPDGK